MITRREFVIPACAAASGAVPGGAFATQAAVDEAVRSLTGGAQVRRGRVKLDAPALIENGNSVVLGVSVESPMTAADYVKSVHVFAPMNPLPNMIGAHFTPRSGRAQFTTRTRVADTQTLVALAQMSDGSFWSDQVNVVVTIAACLEELK